MSSCELDDCSGDTESDDDEADWEQPTTDTSSEC